MSTALNLSDRAAPDLVRLGPSRFVPGYWHGMRQAAVLTPLGLTASRIGASVLQQFDAVHHQLFPERSSPEMVDPSIAEHPVLGRLALFCLDLLNVLRMPTMSGVQALFMQTPDGKVCLMGLPAFHEKVLAPQAALKLAVQLMNQLAASRTVAPESVLTIVRKMTERFRSSAPAGVNTLRFLRAAHDEGIPWRHVVNNVYQFGWGAQSRWLDSSFTDETSNIGARLARDKMSCLKVLKQAGLPVPRHSLVRSAEQAVAAAQVLGFPVVLKAGNLDGGLGVFAGLRSPAAVEKSYAKVAQVSSQILVEEFIAGQDYRLQVFKGEVFWVVHRRPAKVVGDGVSSVEALLDRTNRQRLTAQAEPGAERGTKPILVDDEVLDWLQAQDVSMQSVPTAGQVVRLRGAANVNLGGTLQEVPLPSVHPDNRALAVQAAAVLRLDLAGVDLLVPDIARSWRETGGGICEVNAQPQLSGHLPRSLLPKLVSRRGRIPVVVLIGLPDGWNARQGVVNDMHRHGVTLAWPDAPEDCRACLIRPDVQALVWPIKDMPGRHMAAPVDAVDLLVLFEPSNALTAELAAARMAWPDWARNAPTLWRVRATTGPQDAAISLSDLPERLLSFFLERTADRCES